MRLTNTVKICYLVGIIPIIIGLFAYSYSVSLALWENPELANIPFEDWTPTMQEKNKIIINPYRDTSLLILVFGLTVFYVIPTLISQITSEIQRNTAR